MKKFLIIGNMNAITYKEIFPLIKNNQLWMGTCYVKEFVSKAGEIKKFGNILWYTNLAHKKRNTPLDLYKHYNEEEYPKYDNYDAIEVSRIKDIPYDYDGVMGVPISFLDKYCPTQFEIIGEANHGKDSEWDLFTPSVDGKTIFKRILIKKVKEEDIKEPKDVALLMQYGKKFLIIGNMNAITYKEIFPYIKNNELWLGVSITSGDRRFDVPSDYPLEAATCGIDEGVIIQYIFSV